MTVSSNSPSLDDLQHRLEFASKLALQAGGLAQRLREQGLTVSSKSARDFVTQADQEVEALIRSRLNDEFPQDSILGEEQGLDGDAPGVWVLDPIDGTTNFMKGMDYWCVSIGYVLNGKTQVGVVYAPDREELFQAKRGAGSWLNGIRLSLKPFDTDNMPVIGLGFSERTGLSSYLDTISHILDKDYEYRRFGAGALMLCHVASGEIDAYFEKHLNCWDGIAGVLIIREAQGEIVGFQDNFPLLEGDVILAARPNGVAHLSDLTHL